MRSWTILTCAMILLTAATGAEAGLSVFAGATVPQEVYKDVAEIGVHLGAELTLPVIPSLLSVGAQGTLNRHDFIVPDDYNGSATWYTGEALAIARISVPSTSIYGKVGAGFNRYTVKSNETLFADYESETDLAGAIGAGLSLMGFDLCGMYHVVKWDETPDPENLEEIRDVDTSFSYYSLSVVFGF